MSMSLRVLNPHLVKVSQFSSTHGGIIQIGDVTDVALFEFETRFRQSRAA